MTTLQKIKELLELGYEVEVEEVENGVSYVRTVFDYRFGRFSYNHLDGVNCLLEKEFESSKILRIIPKKPKLLEVGRKVKVVETGEEFDVASVSPSGYWPRGNRNYFEPHEVIPVYDEETETQETIEIAGRKYVKSEFEKAVKDLKEIK